MRNGAKFKNVDLRGAKIGGQLSMMGSTFNGELNMDSVSIERSLHMRNGAKFKNVVLRGAKIGGQLSMMGSTFNGELNMDSVSIERSLHMRNGAKFKNVVLREAKIGGQLSMKGSTFDGNLNMYSVSIGSGLFMDGKATFENVVLQEANIGKNVIMSGSIFNGRLDMKSASIEGSLRMHNEAEFTDVDLRSAKIGDQLSMIGSRFNGALNMSSVSVGDDLLMWGRAIFGNVVLRDAKVHDRVLMNGATFNDTLDMESASIGGSLLMRNRAKFRAVDLRRANIEGQVAMDGSTFKGALNMDGASIGGSLLMTKALFHEPAKLVYLRVGSNLDVRAAFLSELDLSGANIVGALQLGSSDSLDIDWDRSRHAPLLSLRNTRVSFLQDTRGSWPEDLKAELDGFKYSHLGGHDTDETLAVSARGSEWYLEWLERDDSYSPQPYRHLSAVLRDAGHERMADEILFGNRVRERRDSGPSQLKWWRLWILQLVIGYGYGMGNFRAVLWAALFIVIGYVIIRLEVNRKKEESHEDLGFWYSVDMLLPIVRLRERHYERDLQGWPRWYFYVHGIVGYVLTFFVIAGLTGLTS